MMIEREHTSIRLKQAMEEKGMRQVDLLEAVKPYCKRYGVNISKGQLSQYLSGRNEPGQMRIFILALPSASKSEPLYIFVNRILGCVFRR
jgi:transcriptional regulator with XRE-family HTH domain